MTTAPTAGSRGSRRFWKGALRQLTLGACAAGITHLIGTAIGHVSG